MNFSIIAAVVVLSVCCYTEALIKLDKLVEITHVCSAEAGITSDYAEAMMTQQMINDSVSAKKFFRCYYRQLGFYKSNGDLDFDLILKELESTYSKEDSKTALEKCKKIKKTDDLAYVYDMTNCFYDEAQRIKP